MLDGVLGCLRMYKACAEWCGVQMVCCLSQRCGVGPVFFCRVAGGISGEVEHSCLYSWGMYLMNEGWS